MKLRRQDVGRVLGPRYLVGDRIASSKSTLFCQAQSSHGCSALALYVSCIFIGLGTQGHGYAQKAERPQVRAPVFAHVFIGLNCLDTPEAIYIKLSLLIRIQSLFHEFEHPHITTPELLAIR